MKNKLSILTLLLLGVASLIAMLPACSLVTSLAQVKFPPSTPVPKPKPTRKPVSKPIPRPTATPTPTPMIVYANVNGRPVPLVRISFTTAKIDIRGKVTKLPGQSVQGFVEDLGNSVKLEMVEIPAGTFDMGSPDNEKGRGSWETLQRGVRVNTFYLGRFEITQEQWIAVMGRLPWRDSDQYFKGVEGKKLPITSVSWDQAKEFCKQLSRDTNREYRLPTKEEWEYAARAGSSQPFAFGEMITSEVVNFNSTTPYALAPYGKRSSGLIPVGSLGVANAFGLFDMHGNAAEWCEDGWSRDSYRFSRGGDWKSSAEECRSADSSTSQFGSRNGLIGFRVVCVSEKTK